ncbi:MAG: hypothetical protein JOZ17_05095, partial [Acetobacteraceae bacterium]|nr:hypothetical protein [Acetobacteraceae bacterium]
RQQGKIRFFGFTAIGATPALRQVIDAHSMDTAQVVYNVLNPSAGNTVPEGYPGQDYGELLRHARATDMGVINIGVLAGGALTGTEVRHPLGMPSVAPIGCGSNYAADVRRAQALTRSCRKDTRIALWSWLYVFAISHPSIGTGSGWLLYTGTAGTRRRRHQQRTASAHSSATPYETAK